MATTARYCAECIRSLTPATQTTEEEKRFLGAGWCELGAMPNYEKGPKTEEGRCEKCGKQGMVTYYELPN